MGNLLMRRKMLVHEIESDIPSIYQKVEWVEAQKNAIFDTLFTPTENSEIQAGMQFFGNTTSNTCLFGSTNPSVLVLMYSSGTVYMNFARASSSTWNGSLRDSIHDIVLNKNSCTIDGTVRATFAGEPSSFASARHMFIFGYPKNDSLSPDRTSNSRCSYFKIFDNGVLAANLVPCYRKSDTVIGFYDTVAEAFRTKSGTGTVIKGADV